MPPKAQTNICHACTMAGRADCDMAAAFAAGRDACSYCERVKADQVKNGAKRLRECHPTTTTLADAAAMQAQSAPGLVGQQRGGYGGGWRSQRAPGPARQGGGYGAGWGSGGYGMPPMPMMPLMAGYGGYGIPQMPSMMGYGGYGMPPQIQPSASQGGKRKRSEDDATDDDQDDDLDRQIREAKKKKMEQDKRRRLRQLQQDIEKGEEDERAREETARQRQRDAYDEERRINESYREENRRGWDRDRSRSPIFRSERQQVVRRRSPPPDPNSMVDWQQRSRNVQSHNWILNQRLGRERRRHEAEAKATRQANDAGASGGDVDMAPPPTGPRPGGKKRQEQDRRGQGQGITGQVEPQSQPQSQPRAQQTQRRPPVQGEDMIDEVARRIETQGFQLQDAGQPANPAWRRMGMQQQQQQQQQPAADDGEMDMDVYQPPSAIDEVIRRTASGQNPMFTNSVDVILGQLEEEEVKKEETERKKAQGGKK
ncbi:hypothetical protein KC367_g1634 [Hortaea werneckii]|nr:hypothetical protein KC367_g1634 [Hortaea werneckii]